MSKGQGQFDDDGGDYGSFRDDVAPAREEVPRYAAAPPTQPAMQPPPRLRRRLQPRHAAAAAYSPAHGRSRAARTAAAEHPAAAALGGAARAEQSRAAAQPLPVESLNVIRHIPSRLRDARGRDDKLNYRAPKIALPTRTWVAPMAMAAA